MSQPTRTPRVLVVEDSPTQALELRIALEDQGLQVVVATDGLRGLEAFAASRFDLVLSDVLMPGLSGYDLCRRIKADVTGRDVPVVLLTTLKEPTDIIQGLECGADNFLTKPYDADDLVARIDAILAARDSRAGPEPVGGFEIGFMGKTFAIAAGKWQILSFLASTFEDFVRSQRREHESQLAAEKRLLEAEAARAREELLRAEQESLRESEERFRQLAENIREVFWMTTPDGAEILYISPAYEEVWGSTCASLYERPRSWIETIHAEDRDCVRTTFAREVRSGKTWEEEYRIVRPDGSVRWIRDRGFPIRDDRGDVRRVAGIAMDITEIKRAEEELREKEGRFRSFMNNTHAIAFMKDEEGRMVYVNEPFLRCFGGETADWLGKTETELWPEPVAKALRANDLALGDGEVVEVREDVPTAAGDRQWLTFKFRFTDAHGRRFLGGTGIDITEQRRAEREIVGLNAHLERRLQRIDALHRIDMAITSSHDLNVTLAVLLDEVLDQLGVDAAAVLRLDPHDETLSYAGGRGFYGTAIARSRLLLGEGTAGNAALERRIINIPDLSEAGMVYTRATLLEDEGFVAYYAVPLMVKGRVKGVLEVFQRASLDPDQEWLDFLETLAGQAAIAIDSAATFDELQRANAELTAAYDATIEGWSKALDLRDKETEGHSRRVTEMALRVAASLGVGVNDLVNVRRGALLHDIGKMGIPDAILLKPEPLTEEEWLVMRRHPTYAHEWLAPVAFLRPALEIPHCHHERWDGTGYPRGLKGEEIPLAARIFAAVDIWDALRSDRPYRKGWPDEEVRAHIASLAGTHLDSAVVDVFLRCLTSDPTEADHVPRAIESDALERQLGPPPVDTDLGFFAVEVETAERLPPLLPCETHAPPAMPEDEPLRSGESERMLADLRRQNRRLAEQNLRLVELVSTDDLTGLKNRRHFREALEAAFSFAVRQGQPLSVVMLDVDHFKPYNDAHGHPAGDEVLRALAEVLLAQVRPHDVVARHGGEEFAILLPATGGNDARVVAERLRAAIAGRDWPLRPVRASFGVATMTPTLLAAFELVEEADQALYQSKLHGRDRVTHHNDVAASAGEELSLRA